MKNILFSRVNFLTFIPILYFSITGHRVLYLTTLGLFNSVNARKILSKMNVTQMRYDDYKINNAEPKIDSYVNNALIDVVNIIKNNRLFKGVHKRMGGNTEDIDACALTVASYANSVAIETAHMVLFYEAISKKTNHSPVVFAKNNIVSNCIVDAANCEFVNYEPKIFSLIELVAIFLVTILSKLSSFTKNKLSHVVNKKNKRKQQIINSDYVINRKLSDFKVAFLPHAGIFYSSFFIKDQYYSDSSSSIFYNSNILHIMNKHTQDRDQSTLDYYRDNNISSIEFFDTGSLYREYMLKDFLWFFRESINKNSWGNIDGYIIALLFRTLFSVRFSLNRLNALSSLKIMLYGYDVLMPKSISYACKLSNITTVASQERHFFPWSMSSLIVDYYFTIGPLATKKVISSPRYLIGNCYPIGSVRLDDISNQVCDLYDREKYLGGCVFLCLIFDFHSVNDSYENGLAYNNRWGYNAKFYNDIIKMAHIYPDVMFLIKGKNVDFLSNPYFKDIVDKIDSIHNVTILKDVKKVSPYYLVAIADFSIAIYTSIADEMMQSGKPVILYDIVERGLPNRAIGFDDIVSYTEEDLIDKIKKIVVDNNFDVSSVVDKFYTVNSGSVKNRLQKQLEKIASNL